MLEVVDLRKYVTTPLEDTALEGLLTAAYQAIEAEFGPAGDVTERLHIDGGDLLVLSRGAASIAEVLERDVALAEDDYAALSPTLVRRLRTGTHPSHHWRGTVQISYTPIGDDAERDRIAIALVRLDLTYAPGLVSQRIGEYSETFSQGEGTYARDRAAILASYGGSSGAFV